MVTTSPSLLIPIMLEIKHTWPTTVRCRGPIPAMMRAMASSDDTDVLVIGAGQAGLSAAYHLRRLGLEPDADLVTVDHSPAPGGAWQFRWPTLTLQTVNRLHDLPGMAFAETLDDPDSEAVEAATAVPRYYAAYEQRFDLRVRRPDLGAGGLRPSDRRAIRPSG